MGNSFWGADMVRESLRFLVVMAHPHDFTHVAGTCGIHTRLGDAVTWVGMTAGRMTHNERLADELMKPLEEQDPAIVNQSEDDYAAEKTVELRKVAALFGVEDVRVLKYTDKPYVVERQRESVDEIREIILEIRPHIIFTQSPFIRGPHDLKTVANNDHTETGVAVMEAKLLAQLPRQGQRVAPYTTPMTYFPGVCFDQGQSDFTVDVTAFCEARGEAEALYRAQGHTPEYARRRVELTLGNAGMFAGVPYAEGFVQESAQVVSQITLSDYTLKKGTQTREDQINQVGGQRS